MKRARLWPSLGGMLSNLFRFVDVVLDSEGKRVVVLFTLRNGRVCPLGGDLEDFRP